MSGFDRDRDGVDRRGFLRCMAWAGTGLVWTAASGVLRSAPLPFARLGSALIGAPGDFTFAQISDSHIGFNKEANSDVTATLLEAIRRLNALPAPPDFVIHTGDLTHLSKPEEFDTLNELLKQTRTGQIFYVPGEHDVLGDDGRQYLARFGRDGKGRGWYSFDHQGVHFVGLVNVLDVKAGGLGNLGHDQLEWLEHDLKGHGSSTPVVVFAHIPLWSVYPEWGWGTDDSSQALGYLKRFGSVTVLNGHIHQTLRKIEGHVTFHTAASTAFPQPAPGSAASPGPMTVPAERLRSLLGLTEVSFVRSTHSLAVVDHALADSASDDHTIAIDNFAFTPATLTVTKGTEVTWINRDDVPHTVASTTKRFHSPALDTGSKFSFTFDQAGTYPYFCDVHPRMKGTVVVS